MKRFRLIPRLLLLIALAVPAWAGLPPTRTQMILREANDPADLRQRLRDYVQQSGGDGLGAGEASYYLGVSFSRGGQPESALVHWRRARELRNGPGDCSALAEALMKTGRRADLQEAMGFVTPALAEAQATRDNSVAELQGLLAWGTYLSGDPVGARAQFDGLADQIGRSRAWRLRYAEVLEQSGAAIPAIQTARPVAVACRGQDAGVMKILSGAAERIGQVDAMQRDLADMLAARDRVEERAIERMSGQRVSFTGRDGFPLAGVAVMPQDARAPHAAVVLLAPGDTIAAYDSLAAGLGRAGFAVLFTYVRGTGMSVAPSCALPESWDGREEELMRQTSRDVREGVRALARLGKIDTTAILIGGGGSMALAASLAAADDRRARGLLLLSPDPDPVDRGFLRATLARRKMPVFFQQSPEDFPNFEITDMAYHASDEANSRVSDGHSFGHGAVAFRQDPKVTPRFLEWLAIAMKVPVKSAAPPPAPRKG
jgi:pimeloyl-ACP methyl ester carboxylesterase